MPAEAPSFEPEIFGRFYLVDKIATGGMAEIFKAKTFSEGGFENLVVIKRILPHISVNSDFVEMFIDEAKVSAALQHPNVVRIYDFGKIHDNYYIAMDCVEGKDTRGLLKKLGRMKRHLPVKFAAYIAHEVAKGLHYAHTKTDLEKNPYGIIHRDISPSNILISYEADVKIADFGIAKAESNAYQTRDGVLKGKYEYMSPEQALGQSLDRRSDLFSLGIILYECVTGRRLFKTESEIATLKRIQECDFRPPRKFRADLDPKLEKIVLKALSKHPEERFQSGIEFADALRDYLFPTTPDALRQEFKAFLMDVFVDEIEDERKRLHHGSVAALDLHRNAPVELAFDGSPSASTLTMAAPEPAGGMWKWAAALVVLLVMFAAITLGGVAWLLSNARQTEIVVQPAPEVEAPAPTVGDLDIVVAPNATILLDGVVKVEDGMELQLGDLEPGEYTVAFQRDGYESAKETVMVTAGEVTRVVRTLTALPEPEPQPRAGPTPDARPEPRPVPVPAPTAAPTAEPGLLTVTVLGGGWANVYVNGNKLPRQAPLRNYELAPGNYTIRLENPGRGLDHTEQVVVTAGGSHRVVGRPQ
ncbi:MAG: serine/threonine protein kinase [Myxococcota bacterium]